MIAKLCSWAPSRTEAIEIMNDALDRFEIEGISCNISFLSAVMEHEKFVSGAATTAFIEEEFPDGFQGRRLSEEDSRRLAAAAAVMYRFSEIRNARISGKMSHHSRTVGNDWVVRVGSQSINLSVSASSDWSDVTFDDGVTWRVSSEWTPGQTVARLKVGDAGLSMKARPIPNGFKVEYRGAELPVYVWTKMQARLAAIMPEKKQDDTSKQLRCPMPGLIVSIAVKAGDLIEAGQALCTMEAMKMENVLKAERKSKVKRILANVGDTLAVNDLIMEFE